ADGEDRAGEGHRIDTPGRERPEVDDGIEAAHPSWLVVERCPARQRDLLSPEMLTPRPTLVARPMRGRSRAGVGSTAKTSPRESESHAALASERSRSRRIVRARATTRWPPSSSSPQRNASTLP